MSNSILTDSIIVKESLMELKNQLGFTKNINKQYDEKFAVEGAKIGDTINIRKPSRYEVTTGATYVGSANNKESRHDRPSSRGRMRKSKRHPHRESTGRH